MSQSAAPQMPHDSATPSTGKGRPGRGWKWIIVLSLLLIVGLVVVWRMRSDLSESAALAGGQFTHHDPLDRVGLINRIEGLVSSMMGVDSGFSILFFRGGPPKDEWLEEHYADLRDLKILTIHMQDGAVTAAGIKALEGMQSIQQLAVSCSSLPDKAVDSIVTMPNLLHVDLSYTGISDNALEKLSASPQLVGVGIDQTQATAIGLKHIAALPKLRMLTIVGATDETLALIDPAWQIPPLALMEANITEASLPKLKQIQRIQVLSFSEGWLTDEQLATFRIELPGQVIQVLSEQRFINYRKRTLDAAGP